MQRLLKIPLLLFCFTLANLSTFSQDSTRVSNSPILVAIEDSVRDKLIPENDSAWLEGNLALQGSRFEEVNAKYKLVNVTHKGFVSDPMAFKAIIKSQDSVIIRQTPDFGDSIYQMRGERIYTYIGNTSRGYDMIYHFERVYPSKEVLDKRKE